MAGISSSAFALASYPANRKKYNGNELQSGEFKDIIRFEPGAKPTYIPKAN
jgi:hypothetical protein